MFVCGVWALVAAWAKTRKHSVSLDWFVKFIEVGTGKFVKFAPLTAGSVVGNLPFGIIPESSSSAFNVVSDAPEPLNVVAVTIPAKDALPSTLIVAPIPDMGPTTIPDESYLNLWTLLVLKIP